jgi:hypothetical protein
LHVSDGEARHGQPFVHVEADAVERAPRVGANGLQVEGIEA